MQFVLLVTKANIHIFIYEFLAESRKYFLTGPIELNGADKAKYFV